MKTAISILCLVSVFFTNAALGSCDECTAAVEATELSYLRGALRTAWDRYQKTHPAAGHGWRSNARQTVADGVNWVASLPGKIDVVVINTLEGENRYYVKPGLDFGVRCQQVFDGLLPTVLEELEKTKHRFRCLRLAKIVQDGVGESKQAFNHVYFGVVRYAKGTQVSRSMGDVLYFSDPWAAGRADLVPGIGFVPQGEWMGKQVDLGAYQGFEMSAGDGADCRSKCRYTGLPPKFIFNMGTSGGGNGTAVAYRFGLESYLNDLAIWSYVLPFDGNPYALIPAVPVSMEPGHRTRLHDFAGGRWRITQSVSESDSFDGVLTDWATTVAFTGDLSDNGTILDAPLSVDRITHIAERAEDGTYAPALRDMATRTALEVTCDGTWPEPR